MVACPYPYNLCGNNCTNFANTFHRICMVAGKECETIHILCSNPAVGHALNMIKMGERWWLVDPTHSTDQITIADGLSPEHLPDGILCGIMGRDVDESGGCGCSLGAHFPGPEQPNTKPEAACSWEVRGPERDLLPFAQCEECCRRHVSRFDEVAECDPDLETQQDDWFNECWDTCYERWHPSGAGATPTPTLWPDFMPT